MAKRDVYRFSIEANNQEAKKAFEELKVLSKEVQDNSKNLRGDPLGEGNLTKTVKSMTDMLSTYSELTKRLDEEHTINIKMKGNKEALQKIRETRMEVEKETNRMQRSYNDAMHSYRAQTGQKPRVAPRYNENLNEPSATQQQAVNFAEQARHIRNRTNSTLSIGSKALSSKYINHSQATEYAQNTKDLLGEGHQGASLETVLSGKKFTPTKDSVRGQAIDAMEKSRKGIQEREATIASVQKDGSIKDPLQKSAVIDKNTQEIEDLTATIKNAQSVIKELNDSAKKVAPQTDEFEGANVRQKEDRGTTMGRLFERASSMGLAMTGAMAYSVGSKYSQGENIVKGMRPQSLDIGYQTGNSDFRGIRQDLMGQGAEYGYKGKDMLDFTQSVLGGTGFTDQKTLKDMTQNQMEFSKFSGAGQQESSDYLQGLYKTGGVSTAEQAKSIQQGFLGAIKMSGMEGREKEQIEALSAINDNLFKGREATNQEVQNRSAMTTLLASTGNKGLQGENLAGFLTSADNAIKGASPFSAIGMSMGVGKDPRFTGLEGSYNYKEERAKGFTAETASGLINTAMADTGGNTKASASKVDDWLGGGYDVTAIKDLIEQNPEGITQAQLDSITKTSEEAGGDELDSRSDAYMESADQVRESLEAYSDKMKSLLDDNKLVDELKNLSKAVNKWGSKNAGNAMGTTLLGGAMTGITAGLTGVVGSALGTMLPKLFSKAFNPKMLASMASVAGTGGIKGTLGSIVTGGAKGFEKMKGFLGGSADDVVKGAVSGADDVVTATAKNVGKSALSGVDDVAPLLSKGLGMGSKLIGKLALPLQLAMGAFSIATADDKIKETGKQGGALAGGGAGALLGTAIMPGIGTVIGGIAGTLIGSNIGEDIGGVLSDTFGKGKDKKSKDDIANQEDLATDQEEVANEGNQYNVEKLRETNIMSETENLAVAFDLISRIEKALETAKAQNGIVGNTDGLNGSTEGGGSTPGGKLSYTGNSDYWTDTNITKHDLGKTSNALTADQLDEWINANTSKDSIMRGMGSTFMQAGEESGLDPRYLVAHSAHETGWGTSQISKDKGNMYGIGAFDATPYSSAYGYDDTKSGIVEGAKWISKNYYKEGQTTLDSMRNNGGTHEYATDPQWATKIGSTMAGSEKYTKPSSVNVTTNVNMVSTGNTKQDGKNIATETNKNINYSSVIGNNYTQERVRV